MVGGVEEEREDEGMMVGGAKEERERKEEGRG